jgi:hypothetical protein
VPVKILLQALKTIPERQHTEVISDSQLTEDQIGILTRADESLGRRARAKRNDAVHAASVAKHRASVGEPPPKASHLEKSATLALDFIALAQVEPRRRLKALETQNAALDEKCRALEQRILELEAQRAIDHVDR